MADSATVCPKYHKAVELIGRRWAGAIVNVLMHGRRRFNEIAAGIPDVSDRMLVERLRELESEGVVQRIVAVDAPTRVDYELTAKGRALEEAVSAISRWAELWVTEESATTQPVKRPTRHTKRTHAKPKRANGTKPRASRTARRR